MVARPWPRSSRELTLPAAQRPGIPADCGALVKRLTADGATLSLANIGAAPRTVVVQVRPAISAGHRK
jgi:hypothetical protein